MQRTFRQSPVSSVEELDAIERPVRRAFEDFMRLHGLLGTEELVLGMSFTSGGAHFAAKALEFIPSDVTTVLVGALLTEEEITYFEKKGRLVFNYPLNFDNELMYELLLESTGGRFGWIDADCFVLDPEFWDELLAEMESETGAHAAFTYEPLGFAKTPLVIWSSHVRDYLRRNGTTLNSYAPVVTNTGRISAYAVSRVVDQEQTRILEEILGCKRDGSLEPHDGLLDMYANGRTVNSRNREGALSWFGNQVERTGWLVDTPIMAETVLRKHGLRTHRISRDNRQLTDHIIHVGASGYRQRMRDEGASDDYMARFRLTDLFEVLLAKSVSNDGLSQPYDRIYDRQLELLHNEAGIRENEVKRLCQKRLEDEGLSLLALRKDSRMEFLFS